MSHNIFNSLKQTIHDYLVAGDVQKAQHELLAIPHTELSRSENLEFVRLARRSGLDELALRVLSPIVRSPQNLLLPEDDEIIEYANLLQKIGSNPEALCLLNHCKNQKHPRIIYVKACLAVSEWDYVASSRLFREYLSTLEADTYEAMVIRTNLCAGLIFITNYDEAQAEVLKLIQDCEQKKLTRLLIGGKILQAELSFSLAQYPQTLSALNNILRDFPGLEARYRRLISKWLAITLLVSSQGASGAEELKQIRTQAKEHGDWETQRDCDYYSALVFKDQRLMEHLFAGSPYRSLREKFQNNFSHGVLNREDYFLKARRDVEEPEHVLDLVEGRIDNKPWDIPYGKGLSRLLYILLEDFYKPPTVGKIFSKLFPEENYFIEGSPVRVHQMIFKLRAWLLKNNISLEVREQNQYYKAHLGLDLGVRIPLGSELLKLSKEDFRLRQIQALVGQSEFEVSNLIKQLNLSRSSILAVLHLGLKNGVLEQSGNTRNRRYHFKK